MKNLIILWLGLNGILLLNAKLLVIKEVQLLRDNKWVEKSELIIKKNLTSITSHKMLRL